MHLPKLDSPLSLSHKLNYDKSCSNLSMLKAFTSNPVPQDVRQDWENAFEFRYWKEVLSIVNPPGCAAHWYQGIWAIARYRFAGSSGAWFTQRERPTLTVVHSSPVSSCKATTWMQLPRKTWFTFNAWHCTSWGSMWTPKDSSMNSLRYLKTPNILNSKWILPNVLESLKATNLS